MANQRDGPRLRIGELREEERTDLFPAPKRLLEES